MRFFMLFTANVMYMINMISPQFLSEMGKMTGDVAEPNSVPDYFKVFIKTLPVIYLYYTMSELVNYYYVGLSFFEYIIYLVLIVAFAVRMWCYHELGRFFTGKLGIRQDHKLVTSGPYAFAIHPSYGAQFVLMVCFWLLLDCHKLFIIAMIALYTLGLKGRMQMEETMMKRHFGDEYILYCKNRYRLIPFVY